MPTYCASLVLDVGLQPLGDAGSFGEPFNGVKPFMVVVCIMPVVPVVDLVAQCILPKLFEERFEVEIWGEESPVCLDKLDEALDVLGRIHGLTPFTDQIVKQILHAGKVAILMRDNCASEVAQSFWVIRNVSVLKQGQCAGHQLN